MLMGSRFSFGGPKPSVVESMQLGVWHVMTQPSSSSFGIGSEQLKLLRNAFPVILNFFHEIYTISPALFVVQVVSKLWFSIQPVILLYFSSCMLIAIEMAFTQQPKDSAILRAVFSRVICVAVSEGIQWWTTKLSVRFKTRVEWHFREILLKAELRIDIPTSQDKTSGDKPTADQAWKAFDGLLGFATLIIEILAGMLFVSRRDNGGFVFALLCLAKPLLGAVFRRTTWMKPYVVHSNNPHYVRTQSLLSMADPVYRENITTDNISNYISKEFRSARDRLGDTLDEHHEYQYRRRELPWFDMFTQITADFPIIFIAACAIVRPSHFSLSSIATLQTFQTTVRYNVSVFLIQSLEIGDHLNHIQALRKRPNFACEIKNGIFPYPNPKESDKRGMSIEVKDLCFQYPTSKAVEGALRGTSFIVPPGSLTVIVGKNGSGKSTVLKLLTRLYDSTSGEILIDGRSVKDYDMDDLRSATAVVSQDHFMYPMSLADNIGVGFPEATFDLSLIEAAAKQGGSHEFIQKYKDGYQTILDAPYAGHSYLLDESHDKLKAELKKLERPTKPSGGEKQRVIISRLFMRLNSPKIRFIAVDEPSSALDPQAEQELFKQIRNGREGKTIIVVSHRFGHLTKFADQIICMGTDGKVAEVGTHDALMQLKGQYFNLYDAQQHTS